MRSRIPIAPRPQLAVGRTPRGPNGTKSQWPQPQRRLPAPRSTPTPLAAVEWGAPPLGMRPLRPARPGKARGPRFLTGRSSDAGRRARRAGPGAVPRRFFGYLAHLINDQLLIKSQTTGPKPETFCLSPAIWCQWSQLRTFQTQGFESTFAQNTARHSSRTSPVSARRSEGPCVLQCPARAAPSERGHLSKPGLPTPGT